MTPTEKDMEAAREAVRELDETHNLLLHLGKTVVDTLERRIAAALAKVREKTLCDLETDLITAHTQHEDEADGDEYDDGRGDGIWDGVNIIRDKLRALAKEERHAE